MSLAKDKQDDGSRPLYADDVYGWALEQARLLRMGRFGELDLPNLADEIESLGSEQLHALESSYRVLIVHLLKWQYQPERRSRSWDLTIVRERHHVERREARNRALHASAGSIIADIYPQAVREAAKETGLSRAVFPETCPWTAAQLRDPDFMPE
ncbi:DUF29 domain-containing protein [Aurantimonas sp. A2-1-M11]|uniref:DUF29 domain-containing protein n=1 Tax=Aurantimonas sp. A2-1-M11 TaxID=3113712 RepID=UPI002F91E8DF